MNEYPSFACTERATTSCVPQEREPLCVPHRALQAPITRDTKRESKEDASSPRTLFLAKIGKRERFAYVTIRRIQRRQRPLRTRVGQCTCTGRVRAHSVALVASRRCTQQRGPRRKGRDRSLKVPLRVLRSGSRLHQGGLS